MSEGPNHILNDIDKKDENILSPEKNAKNDMNNNPQRKEFIGIPKKLDFA